jgi:acetyl esterase/lipase
VSTEQRENLDAILRQNAFPFDSDVSEQRRLLKELASTQPLPIDVTVTAAALGGVPTAEITIDGIEPRHVVLYFHGGVYVIGDAFQAADLASQVGRRTRAKVISVDYRLAPEHPYPAAHTGQPIGIITGKDIAHAVADGKDLEQTRIHDLMTGSR